MDTYDDQLLGIDVEDLDDPGESILFDTDSERQDTPMAVLSSPNAEEQHEEATNPRPMDTDNPEPTPRVGDKLLSLRKEYKKISVAKVKAKSHLDFLSQCRINHQTPKGLQMNMKCSALLADMTDVGDRFQQTTDQAQNSYMDHLQKHYDVVVDQLGQKENLLVNTMDTCHEIFGPG